MAEPDGISRSWSDLHRLRASFDAPLGVAARAAMRGLARSLGATAVPLCARALAGDAERRAYAVELLRAIAAVAYGRVVDELRAVVARPASDDAKLTALALLAELGDETTTARFADPRQVHRQSLARFADQLDTPAEIASAADLLVSRLGADELVEFVEAFSEADPERARQLGDELAGRVDLDVAARGELGRVTAPLKLASTAGPGRPPARALGRPALLVGLRHPDGRTVITVVRKASDRWRALAVLCGEDGALLSVRYDDDTTPRAIRDAIVGPLTTDGYQPIAMTSSAAHRAVASAAKRAVAAGRALPSGYYLGRDLLGLADHHLGAPPGPERGALLGRAIDLLAGGAPARARPLLEHCARTGADDADAHAHLGLCRYAEGDYPGAVEALTRAAWLEPGWPLHHWNLAAAAHRAGDLASCARALHDFLEHADDRLAAHLDTEHRHRVALARRFLADHGALRRTRPGDQGFAPST
ncbi:MAG: hypothetical protein KBG48_14935 [Kofleriaceae bacterium]|nr:hypothetical protein [Kofleriaceae bacterium]MBP9168689.1 hypothetical protein [Kofleriaceae bacterium]MBP9862704.1 hypothetical protein [Kofleriaceae bacterium]